MLCHGQKLKFPFYLPKASKVINREVQTSPKRTRSRKMKPFAAAEEDRPFTNKIDLLIAEEKSGLTRSHSKDHSRQSDLRNGNSSHPGLGESTDTATNTFTPLNPDLSLGTTVSELQSFPASQVERNIKTPVKLVTRAEHLQTSPRSRLVANLDFGSRDFIQHYRSLPPEERKKQLVIQRQALLDEQRRLQQILAEQETLLLTKKRQLHHQQEIHRERLRFFEQTGTFPQGDTEGYQQPRLQRVQGLSTAMGKLNTEGVSMQLPQNVTGFLPQRDYVVAQASYYPSNARTLPVQPGNMVRRPEYSVAASQIPVRHTQPANTNDTGIHNQNGAGYYNNHGNPVPGEAMWQELPGHRVVPGYPAGSQAVPQVQVQHQPRGAGVSQSIGLPHTVALSEKGKRTCISSFHYYRKCMKDHHFCQTNVVSVTQAVFCNRFICIQR